MTLTPIHRVQGTGLLSPLAGQAVAIRGVVTGTTAKGFFVQDPQGPREGGASSGVFVFSPRDKPRVGSVTEVRGMVIDYIPKEGERPTTQIERRDHSILREDTPRLEPEWLTAERIGMTPPDLATFLNSIEGMLAGVEKGATIIAPSNPFGDYVALPPGCDAPRTRRGGVRLDPARPERWYPSFRFTDYARAPRVDVGAELLRPVVGPLNYRSSAFQIAALAPPRVRPAEVVREPATTLRPSEGALTILTLNGFNLDAKVEDPSLVNDPHRDVDDDLGDGRFALLARAIVTQAASPDIVALQEMQDDDGAEITSETSAEKNGAILIAEIQRLGGPPYRWADVAPIEQDDGGQPGGNIRNAFLYAPERIDLLPKSLRRLGEEENAFAGSRKPLVARFRHRQSRHDITVINVHLASKRHQHSLFAAEQPGHDPRESVRVDQARLIRAAIDSLDADLDYYVTGDFNDVEFSRTLRTLTGADGFNLVDRVPPEERYDYNHRGVSQALMHGIVRKRRADAVEYEILHGNELIGTQPGELGGKATDHAYVIARFAKSR